jgi:hypothetical protein
MVFESRWVWALADVCMHAYMGGGKDTKWMVRILHVAAWQQGYAAWTIQQRMAKRELALCPNGAMEAVLCLSGDMCLSAVFSFYMYNGIKLTK